MDLCDVDFVLSFIGLVLIAGAATYILAIKSCLDERKTNQQPRIRPGYQMNDL